MRYDNPNEQEYLDALRSVLHLGTTKGDRTGVGTISLTGAHMRFDLGAGFPLLTTKRMFWKGIVAELLWMLSGSTNAGPLRDQGVHIWDEWADEKGDLGPIYGKQWRFWTSHVGRFKDPKITDQIANLLDGLKTNPLSRRHVITTWNPAELDQMALPPCHGVATQFVCEPLNPEGAGDTCKCGDYPGGACDGCGRRYRLSCVMHQRSGDMFLGVPFNIASYSLLTQMIAAECDMVPGDFVHTIGDAHIYSNHVEQVKEQLSRAPYEAPSVRMNWHYDEFDGEGSAFSVLGAKPENIILGRYQHHPAIKAPVAV